MDSLSNLPLFIVISSEYFAVLHMPQPLSNNILFTGNTTKSCCKMQAHHGIWAEICSISYHMPCESAFYSSFCTNTILTTQISLQNMLPDLRSSLFPVPSYLCLVRLPHRLPRNQNHRSHRTAYRSHPDDGNAYQYYRARHTRSYTS